MSQGRAKEIGFLIWVTSWCHWSLEPKQLQKRGSRGLGKKKITAGKRETGLSDYQDR